MPFVPKERSLRFRFTDDGCLKEDYCGIPIFIPDKFYQCDIRGRINEYEVIAHEIHEVYYVESYKENNKLKETSVLQFKTRHEAQFFLELFKWLLNHGEEDFAGSPELQACRREISKQITTMLANAPLDEIAERHEQREQLLQRIREAETNRPELTKIYAFHYDNNCTKIGISERVYQRMSQLEPPPIEIDSFAYTTKNFTREQALTIEAECHKFFAPKRKNVKNCREYFNISLEEACKKLEEYSDLYIANDKCQRYIR